MSNRAPLALPCASLLLLASSLPLALSCAGEGPAEPLSLRVVWGLTGTSVLPAAVTDIEIVTCENAGQADEICTNNTCSVNTLRGMNEREVATCRPNAGTEMYMDDPVLVRSGLTTGVPIRFELRGKSGAEVLYVGHAGPFMLGEGERRFVDLQMYSVGSVTSVPNASVERFLHTATRLPDGRILVAGGFTSAAKLPMCPDGLGLAAEASCFGLLATDEALAFDPSSGKVESIRSSMLAARGGHTATALPDGRVLIAGGAERAVLAMIPQGAAASGGYRIGIFPQRASGEDGAHDSFELYDAFLGAEDGDPGRDGDIGRGRFLGTAGQSATPGALNQPRFMHAAAAVPAFPDRVVLAGGAGGGESAATFEVFDNQRTGGYGMYAATENRLATPRVAPSAIGIDERVWIVGGTLAADDAQLAEIWSADGEDPNGASASASGISQFPSATSGVVESHPEYSLVRPLVAPVNGGARALVSGWYGPQCEPGTTAPVFASATSEYCNSPATGSRSFTIDGTSGLAASTVTGSRSFGAVAELGCFRPGRDERYIAMTGGIANAIWTPQASIDLFSGEVDGTGAARRLSGVSASLVNPRLFHTSTGIPGLGVVTIGGITFTVGIGQVSLTRSVEVLFIPRDDYDGC